MNAKLRKRVRPEDELAGVKTEETREAENLPEINWSETAEAWVCTWAEEGVTCRVSFSVSALGEEKALSLAMKTRRRIETAVFTAPETLPADEVQIATESAPGSPLTNLKSRIPFPVPDQVSATADTIPATPEPLPAQVRPPARNNHADKQSGVTGVTWDEGMKRWRTNWYEGGKKFS